MPFRSVAFLRALAAAGARKESGNEGDRSGQPAPEDPELRDVAKSRTGDV
jgi:hypothetical protein